MIPLAGQGHDLWQEAPSCQVIGRRAGRTYVFSFLKALVGLAYLEFVVKKVVDRAGRDNWEGLVWMDVGGLHGSLLYMTVSLVVDVLSCLSRQLLQQWTMANLNGLNVYFGQDSLKKYFNPDEQPPLPLVELPEYLNPYYQDGVRIYAKMMTMHPANNVKAMPGTRFSLLETKWDA